MKICLTIFLILSMNSHVLAADKILKKFERTENVHKLDRLFQSSDTLFLFTKDEALRIRKQQLELQESKKLYNALKEDMQPTFWETKWIVYGGFALTFIVGGLTGYMIAK